MAELLQLGFLSPGRGERWFAKQTGEGAAERARLCKRFSSLMVSEAAAAGFAETAFRSIPKIQIPTIEDLLNYRMPRLPAIDSSAFRKAPKEKSESQAGFDF
jgi:hypothetical protein